MEISYLGVLGGMVFRGMESSGFVWFMFRGMRIHFSQDHMCRVLQNSESAAFAVSAKDCGIRSCEVSRVKVCEVLANFLASVDVKASLVCGSFKRLEW